MVAPATAPRAARFSPRPRPEAVRQCVVSMVAADSEGPEDRPSGKPDLRVEVEGVAGVTSDLGVDLQVTKLWEEGLEASFCLFGRSVQYLPGSSSPLFLWDSLVAAILNPGLSPAPWNPLVLVTVSHRFPRRTRQSRVSLSISRLHLIVLPPCPSTLCGLLLVHSGDSSISLPGCSAARAPSHFAALPPRCLTTSVCCSFQPVISRILEWFMDRAPRFSALPLRVCPWPSASSKSKWALE